VSNSFIQADQALWQLSRQARTMPVVRQTLEQHPAAEIMPLLASHPEGQIFLAELHVWLNRYGERGHKFNGLAEISWREDPTPVIHNLRETLTWPDQDLQAEIQAQLACREQLIAQARQRLQSRPASQMGELAARFDTQLKAAQSGEFLLTEHNFWIDQQAMYRLRCVFLEVGRRFVEAGHLHQPEEIFYLFLDELAATAQSTNTVFHHTVVDERKAQLMHFRTLTPPDALGTMPLMAPPDEPFVRAMSRLFGSPLIPTTMPPRIPSSVLRGQAASPGKIRGHARVIRSLDEAERLHAGDILVTAATMPPWTPLLAIAGAVVTDSGGILSHAAIVAREYNIPAVVATRLATQIIQEGQLLEVDGSTGVVYILHDIAL
jgi:pyruvate,water dikinase